ncbi:hypothetical protein [Rubripirellula reticaptiva]|uniref:HEAT repeat protein n=1 Tax=Rubripirellula reticaptiva TaxID=2528013 RepID=A0A5C6EK34_9BACT|nr:hypothetical protein [Rubripirellula reticaptiva]TWU48467.1 hypothetical protein Poly59_53150 [Rubripirellula reticaptiva]
MNSADFSNVPNPFAMVGQAPVRPRRTALWSSLKFLVLVAVCFAIVLAISFGSKRFLLHRLLSDFDSVGALEQQSRLVQLAEMGTPAIVPLVEAMTNENIEVARSAFELLHGLQNDWTVLDVATQQTRHRELVAAVESIAPRISDDRTGWAASLLQQTISDFVTREDSPSRDLYASANETLEMLTLSGRPGPSVLADKPLDPMSPQRLQVRSRPLPVQTIEEETNPPSASIYKSASMRLQPLPPDAEVELRDIDEYVPVVVEKPVAPRETVYHVQPAQSIAPVVEDTIVSTPMEAYDDVSVIHWLASDQNKLREQARLELMSRGYTERELSLATRISAADVPTRMQLVDMIAAEPSIDPRPWLFMMSRDTSRDVRLRVVAVIATMNDAAAKSHLQKLMIEETDPHVATRIRKALELR